MDTRQDGYKAGWIQGRMDTRQDGSMLSCFLRQILTLPSECRSWNRFSSNQATFFQSSIVQFWWDCANCSLSFLLLAERSGTRCGLLLLQPICFKVRRVVQRWYSAYLGCGYLSYCCLSIISNHSAHCPLTSDINKAFSSTELPLTG